MKKRSALEISCPVCFVTMYQYPFLTVRMTTLNEATRWL